MLGLKEPSEAYRSYHRPHNPASQKLQNKAQAAERKTQQLWSYELIF